MQSTPTASLQDNQQLNVQSTPQDTQQSTQSPSQKPGKPLKPSLTLDQVKELSQQGHIIPLHTNIPADLTTPISAYLKWCKCSPDSFLFESVNAGEQIGRYSFLGACMMH